ncbi:TPA: polysaccharide biosynthesis/export family protein [Legionella pneumophila]
MKKKVGFISCALALSGCGTLPGMENLNTSKMNKITSIHKIPVQSTLIPITPELLNATTRKGYHYLIAPSDVLNIVVWQHKEFTPEGPSNVSSTLNPSTHGAAGQPGYLVNNDGEIYFPLVGYVKVAGKTVDAVRIDLSEKLRKYVINPQINVRVADYRSKKVYVFGEVLKPGFLPVNDQVLNIADALSMVGGIDQKSANPRYIYVIRANSKQHLSVFWLNAKTPDALILAEQFSLRSKDILYVSSAPATRWNRALNQIVPTVQTIWYTKSIVNS